MWSDTKFDLFEQSSVQNAESKSTNMSIQLYWLLVYKVR